DDAHPSLGVSVGDDDRVLLICRSRGCSAADICKAMGLTQTDLFPPKNGKSKKKIAAEYDYVDADGKLLYQVIRYDPKGFHQRRPDGNGEWIWKLGGVQRVLYRLPQVLKAVADGQPVYVTEGEKDADNLIKLGLVATTNAGGADNKKPGSKWLPSYSDTLRGANVIILPDNDEPGRLHGEAVAQSLRGKAASIHIVNLPSLPPKGDVSDWLAMPGNEKAAL